MTERPPEQRRNSYAPEDLDQLVKRRDKALEVERDEKKLATDKRKRAIKIIEAEAKNVGIPLKSFRKLLKVRDYQAKIAETVEKVPDDEIEVFADMNGQLAFLKPEKPGETDVQIAARQRIAEIQKITDEEQQAGQEALDELASGQVH